jgi:hypothetical protein
MIDWNEELVAKLTKGMEDGKTYTQLADEFGVSRSVIAGKIRRLRLGQNKDGLPPIELPSARPRRKTAKPKPKREPVIKLPPAPPVDSAAAISLTATSTSPSLTAPDPIHIRQLEGHHCRAIVTGIGADALYCGDHAVEGESWCPHHMSIYCNE